MQSRLVTKLHTIEKEGIEIESFKYVHCAPRLHEALGTKNQGAIRFSFSYFTTYEELDGAINALRQIAS